MPDFENIRSRNYSRRISFSFLTESAEIIPVESTFLPILGILYLFNNGIIFLFLRSASSIKSKTVFVPMSTENYHNNFNMKKFNIITKVTLYFSFLSGVIWTGSYLLRMLLFYQLFKVKDFELKDQFSGLDLGLVFNILLPSVTTTFVSYIVFLVMFILFIYLSKINVRQNGWLFIVLMFVLITAPFEIYLMTIDFNIITGIYYNSASTSEILGFIIKRFKILSSFSVIEILCFFSMYYFVLFKPLKKKDEN